MAPPGVRFVMGVSIHSGSDTGNRLKARITLLERARSAVRVLGRRVYVDFSPDSLPPAAAQPTRSAATAGPKVTATPATGGPAAGTPAVVTPSAEAAASSRREEYRAAVQPAIERFEQLSPFMVSAAASPSEPVLKAIGSTLVGIQGLLLSVDAPAESKTLHD